MKRRLGQKDKIIYGCCNFPCGGIHLRGRSKKSILLELVAGFQHIGARSRFKSGAATGDQISMFSNARVTKRGLRRLHTTFSGAVGICRS